MKPLTKTSIANRILSIVAIVCLLLAIARIVVGISYFKVYIVGASMNDTLVGATDKNSSGGDYVYAYRSQSPRRGDIVIIDTPDGKGVKTIIKRVIAFGGEVVELKGGVLYLNGSPVEEPYVGKEHNTPYKNNFPSTAVPEGCLFCLGDNRDVSADSRSDEYGCMPVEWVRGIVTDWSLTFKGALTAFNTFFEFTIPNAIGLI